MLFKLDDNGAYHWYRLFIILSLDKAEPYLHELGFPLDHKSAELATIAKDFVLKCHEIQLQTNYTAWQDTTETKSLFNRSYEMLVDRVGKENADAFCEWGNRLQFSNITHHSLRIYEELLYSLDPRDTVSDSDLPSLPYETLKWLVSTIRQHREKLKEINLGLDELDETPKSAWENQVISILNVNGLAEDGAPSISPFNELATLIYGIDNLRLLKTIKKQLSIENLKILEQWLKSQPVWIEDQSRSTQLYYRSYTLAELLERM